MAFLEWNEQYELGLPHIDLQHTMIVNMINELYMSLETREEEDTTDKILEKLLCYVEEHFATEESAMQENNYPDQDTHLAAHEAFKVKVNRLHHRHQAGERIAGHELSEFLKDWLLEHIATMDKAFGTYVFQLSEKAKEEFFRQNPKG
jgi:hemerythrin-like metal-binding protein